MTGPGFFAWPKGRGYPHLALLMPGEPRPETAHWSVRRHVFTPGAVHFPGSCQPRSDYAQALRAGAVVPGAVLFGSALYDLPAKMQPRVEATRLSLRSDAVLGAGPFAFALADRVTMTLAPRRPFWADRAQPLARLDKPMEVQALASGQRLYIAGDDPDGGGFLALSCLHGAWADRTCHAQVIRNGVGNAFMLRLQDVAAWRALANRVEALFQGLRVPPDAQAKLP